MRGLTLIPAGTTFNFTSYRFVAYSIAIFLVALSLFGLVVKGLSFGIDFRGGILLEVKAGKPVDLSQMRDKLSHLDLGEVKLQEFGSPYDVVIRVEHPSDGESPALLEKIKSALGPDIEYRRVETVGPKVSEDLILNGMWAIIVSLLGILVYIWFRFEWQFGLCGVLTLIHDVFIVLGFYALSGVDFNESALVALLTTLGYSINDSVVIYDRLRENLRKYKKTPLTDVINLSINETLSRTILTSGTTLLSLVALYWFGGPVIENFSLPILVGIVVGTLSSIFLSVNFLLFFDLRSAQKAENTLRNPSER